MNQKKYLNLKNQYTIGKLPNKLKYIVSPNPYHNTVSILFMVRVGSRNETSQEYGLAHYLEHMLFKGNRTYPTYQKLNLKLDQIHAETNAYTHKHYTAYYIKLPSRNFDIGLEVLREMIFYSNLEPKELEKEKKVVIEEINKTIDDSLDYASDLLDQYLFEKHPLSHFILGTKKNISDLKKSQLDKFYRKHYVPNNMVVAISGKIPSNLKGRLLRILGGEKHQELELKFEDFKLSRTEPKIIVKSRKQEQIALVLGFPTFGLHDSRNHQLDVLSNLLYGNMTSRLWMRLRENNPIVYGLSIDTPVYEEGGYLGIELGLSKKNLPQALKILYVELDKLKKKLVPKKELQGIQENLIESLLEEEDNNLDVASFYGEKLLLELKMETYQDEILEIKKITSLGIKKLCQHIFDFSKMTVVEVGDVSQTTLKKLVRESFNL